MADRYDIERELGRGGMATVYLARDRRHGRQVALKVLRRELSGVVGGDRFAREIAIAARLNHARVLPLYDSGAVATDAGLPVSYYTMPYVTGPSLRQRLEDEPQLPVEEAVEIARQVAEALDYAHQQGVVHRDIKPENILLAEGGALVADFGIARALDAAGGKRLTETGLTLGTPAYMSPEQGGGSSRVDGRTDIYALGCVLYEMLGGQPPFSGPTMQAVLARHAIDPVPSLRTVRATVSPTLSRVVERALAKVPADRYPTARAFGEALAVPSISGTQAVTALTPIRASRRRLLSIGVGLAALLAIGIAVAVKARSSGAAPVAVDPTLVAVAPFRVASADPSLGYLREGMVDLLAAKLSGTLALRPADARAMQRTWRTAADQGGDVPEQEALRLAAGLGAGRLVEGEVVSSGRRLTVSAALVDAPGGHVRARAAIEGAVDSLTSLLDQVAARLIALGAGEPEQRLPALAATSLPALRAYIDGRILIRRNDYAGAIKRFESALAADSAFALAGLGLLRANLETIQDPRSAQIAWRLRDRLSTADRAQLEALLGPRYPEENRGVEPIQAAERYTQLAPDDPEAWDLYAAHLCCEGPLLGVPDAQQRAKSAFGRALSLDSSFTLAANGFTSMAAVLRDTGDMRRGLRLVMRADSASPSSVALQWHVATVLGDTATARRLALADSMISTRADAWAQTGPWAVVNVFLQEGIGNRDLDLVFQRSLDAAPTDDQRWSILDLRYRLAVMRGRATNLPLPSRLEGTWVNIVRVLDALFSDADPAPAVPAAAALEREVGRPLRIDDCCINRFAVGQYALQTGRLATARRAAADIEAARATGPHAAADNAPVQAYALMIRAQLAAREGSASTARLLGQLDSVLTDMPSGWEKIPLYGNLIAARLHAQRKEYGPALAAIRRRDWTRNASEHVTYHREEGRIAAEAGDTAGAVRAYRRYLGIRSDAEPRLRPEVERVRAELAALERTGTGP